MELADVVKDLSEVKAINGVLKTDLQDAHAKIAELQKFKDALLADIESKKTPPTPKPKQDFLSEWLGI